MPTSDGESNPATALCTGMVFPWGLSLSEKKEKKKEAVVQIRNDHLLFSNDSFTGSGWLVSTSPCLWTAGWSSHREPSLELPDQLLCLARGITSYRKKWFTEISRLPIQSCSNSCIREGKILGFIFKMRNNLYSELGQLRTLCAQYSTASGIMMLKFAFWYPGSNPSLMP